MKRTMFTGWTATLLSVALSMGAAGGLIWSLASEALSSPEQKAITIYTKRSSNNEIGGTKEQLLGLARQRGSIRVIVGLSVPFQLSRVLSMNQETAQTNALRSVQRRVADRILGSTVGNQDDWLSFIPYMIMTVDSVKLLRLLEDPDVESIQLETAGRKASDPKVRPDLSQSVDLIHARDLWRKGIIGTGHNVAVIDTGIDRNHPMFVNKLAANAEACYSKNTSLYASLCKDGKDWIHGAGAGTKCALAGCGHGTHVAGIAVGRDANESKYGVAPGSGLVAIQVFSKRRSDNRLHFQDGDLIKALERVYWLRQTAKITAVNLSLSSSGLEMFSSHCDSQYPAIRDAVYRLHYYNVPVIAASGNEFQVSKIGMPACISSAIAVGNTTKNDVVHPTSNDAPILDLLAPGTDIVSAYPPGAYPKDTGTSQAAPHVAGAIALLRQARPSSSYYDLAHALDCTGKTVTRRLRPDGSIVNLPRPEPRIDLLGAYNRIMRFPTVTRSWQFDTAAEYFDWSPIRGNWRVTGGMMQQTPLTAGVVGAGTSVCSRGGRIVARLRRADPQVNKSWSSGVFIGWRAWSGTLRGSGYFASFNDCPTDPQGWCINDRDRRRAELKYYRIYKDGRIEILGTSCLNNVQLSYTGWNTVALGTTPTTVTFHFNGKLACSISTNLFDRDSPLELGVMAEMPSVLTGQSLIYDSVSVTTNFVASPSVTSPHTDSMAIVER